MSNRIIKFDEVKTLRDFEIIADRYYQRAHRLRAIWQNENESAERKEKAFRVWIPLLVIIPSLMATYSNLVQQAMPKFGVGGIISQVYKNESIINKK